MPDTRLIERWLPIAALGVESKRERTPMTPFPAPNRLHVWWARRPLVAARAAVLASLLPADADREKFLHVIGIHGDPVATRRKIDAARRRGERFEGQAYSYPRAFGYVPDEDDKDWWQNAFKGSHEKARVLDPTAGGGSIPFEAIRLGAETFANDLNPVSTLIMRATVEWPSRYGKTLKEEFEGLSNRFVDLREERLARHFPAEPTANCMCTNFIWARTVTCPYCDGRVPLSPNWRLAPDGTGVRLRPETGAGPGTPGRVCSFEIVRTVKEQSPSTVARGDGTCPYPDCERVIDGDQIKVQAQAEGLGEQLFAVVYKERVRTTTKTGKPREKWVRRYRGPRPEDDNSAEIQAMLDEKLPEWEALDMIPSEYIGDLSNYDRGHKMYGMHKWTDVFSPRQLLCHGTGVEVFREMLDADRADGKLTEVHQTAYAYLALSLDKLLNYNSRMSVWMPTREVMANTFNRHGFAFCWTHGEMAPLIVGLGYDWTIKQTAKCVKELVTLIRPGANAQDGDLFGNAAPTAYDPPTITITCKPGDSLDHIEDASIDAVVMDPPYGANVMYAELSDFFYVWLKRTAGHVFPELFRRNLTDKEHEAVANPAKFQGTKGAAALAERDYQERMASIFAECRRVLKSDGIMTVMFTHKETSAWDALTKGLMEAGFVITASWPINTEAEGSLHIKDKAAANSTIFLVCRPRRQRSDEENGLYWEDVEPEVARAVRSRVEEFQEAGISGVDLYLASFGPALEEFSRHWPLRRGTPRAKPETLRRRRQQQLFEEEWEPLRRHPGGRPRHRPARSQALAREPAHEAPRERGPRPDDCLLRAGLGHLSRTDIRLRRSAWLEPRHRGEPRSRRRWATRREEGKQPPVVGQRRASCTRRTRTRRWVSRHDRRTAPGWRTQRVAVPSQPPGTYSTQRRLRRTHGSSQHWKRCWRYFLHRSAGRTSGSKATWKPPATTSRRSMICSASHTATRWMTRSSSNYGRRKRSEGQG